MASCRWEAPSELGRLDLSRALFVGQGRFMGGGYSGAAQAGRDRRRSCVAWPSVGAYSPSTAQVNGLVDNETRNLPHNILAALGLPSRVAPTAAIPPREYSAQGRTS